MLFICKFSIVLLLIVIYLIIFFPCHQHFFDSGFAKSKIFGTSLPLLYLLLYYNSSIISTSSFITLRAIYFYFFINLMFILHTMGSNYMKYNVHYEMRIILLHINIFLRIFNTYSVYIPLDAD